MRARRPYFSPLWRDFRWMRSGGTESASAAARAIVCSHGRPWFAPVRIPQGRRAPRTSPPRRGSPGCRGRRAGKRRCPAARNAGATGGSSSAADWPASPPARRASQAGGPSLHLIEDRAGRVFLEEVPRAFQPMRPVDAREGVLPPFEMRFAEPGILQRPADQRRLLPQPREVVLDECHGRVGLVKRVLRLRAELGETRNAGAVVWRGERRAAG